MRTSRVLMCVAASVLGPMVSAASPHPIITEALFHVPKEQGDANADGKRHAVGDEFVELHNPTSKPINLKGYQVLNRLTARDDETTLGVRFEFPDFTLGPGETVVVFNGYESSIPSSGDQSNAPGATSPHFHGAWVFTMNPGSRYNAFANAGDAIALRAPNGRFVEVLTWGKPDPAPPSAARTHDVAKEPRGSVARATPDGDFEPHTKVDAGKPHSPGRVPWVKGAP